jgi:hypothetical protein
MAALRAKRQRTLGHLTKAKFLGRVSTTGQDGKKFEFVDVRTLQEMI